MEDLSLHILDVVENAVRAQARKIEVALVEDKTTGVLTVSIRDDGIGMDRATVKKVRDPFFTTKEGKKVGLGLALLWQAAQETGGDLDIKAEPGKGTEVTAVFHITHPDMKPVGDVVETMAALITANPSIRFVCDCRCGDYNFHFDSFASREKKLDGTNGDPSND